MLDCSREFPSPSLHSRHRQLGPEALAWGGTSEAKVFTGPRPHNLTITAVSITSVPALLLFGGNWLVESVKILSSL